MIKVKTSKLLPFKPSYPASRVDTRQQVNIVSDSEINSIFDKENNVLYVSEEIYKNMELLLPLYP